MDYPSWMQSTSHLNRSLLRVMYRLTVTLQFPRSFILILLVPGLETLITPPS